MAKRSDIVAPTGGMRSGIIGAVEVRAARFFDLLSRLRDEDGDELVHDIRVFSRRLGEGLRALRPFVEADRVTPLIAWLGDVRRSLAPVRDADVMGQLLTDLFGDPERLAAVPAASGFVGALVGQRKRALTEARGRLGGDLPVERHDELMVLVAEGVGRAGCVPTLQKNLARRLRQRAKRRRAAFLRLARRAAKSLRPRRLHAARIAGKRIRYALELADEAKVLDAADEVKVLRRVQDALGDLNDLTVLRCRVQAFARQADASECLGVDEILARVKRRQRRAIKRFAEDWPKTRRRLEKVRARKRAN